MSPYRIQFHDANGAIVAEQIELFEQDDDAIDHVGQLDHRDALRVWRGERLVAHFPPLGSGISVAEVNVRPPGAAP